MAVVLVFVGGCVGAVGRFVTDRAISARHDMLFPWGTFAVNMVGSAVLGVVIGGASSEWVAALVGTGFCGALTTYSTYSFETVRLLEEGSVLVAVANVVASLVLGVACVTGGFALGHAVL
jgi:fluoride exporter